MIEYAADVEVHVGKHRRVYLHPPRRSLLLVRREFAPFRYIRKPREWLDVLTDEAEFFHSSDAQIAHPIVTLVILPLESVQPVVGGSERAMNRLVRKVGEERPTVVAVLVDAVDNELGVSGGREIIGR